MRQDSFRVEGIVIKRKNFKECDRLITIFSKQKGKIILLAKGVRKLHSRRSPSIELFNSLILYIVPSHNINILTETQLLNNYCSWKENLVRVGVAYYFCELVDKLTAEQQSHPTVYVLLQDSLRLLETENLGQLIRNFEEKLLVQLGFGLPESLVDSKGSLINYIESITERKINSPKIIKSFSC